LFEDVVLNISLGAKIGVLGINGSGKSSLLKIIAGVDKEYEGDVIISKGISVGYVAQEPVLDESKDVKGNIMDGVPSKKRNLLNAYMEICNHLEKNPTLEDDSIREWKQQKTSLEKQIDEENLFDLNRKIARAMSALRCPASHRSIAELSGGEKRRIALCRLLIAQPDFLLLDEPTNHLDAESVSWLEHHLREYSGTVVAITHDRYFLDNVASLIIEIDQGKLFSYQGNYSAWLLRKEERQKLETKREDQRNKILSRELEWIRQSPKGRNTKNKARIQSYERLLEESHRQRSHLPGTISIKPGPRLGDVVLEIKGLSKSYEDRVLFRDVSLKLEPGAIVGIVGPNGCGKTTLFNIISGRETPDSGSIKLGETVRFAFVSQTREEQLNPDYSVYEEVSEGQETFRFGQNVIHARSYLAAVSFLQTQIYFFLPSFLRSFLRKQLSSSISRALHRTNWSVL